MVYQTVFENFVVLIQQKRQGDVWQTCQHCLIPKLFINAIASLPEKTEPAECILITSGGQLPPKALPTFQHLDMEYYLTTLNEFCFGTIATVCLCLKTS